MISNIWSIVRRNFSKFSNYKIKAFTLAEILITLAIIGIIAVLTVPNLLTKYQKHTKAIRLKKIHSEIHQAIKMAEAEHGSVSTWDYSTMGNNYAEIRENFAKDYFYKYLNGTYCSPGKTNLQACISLPFKTLKGVENLGSLNEAAILTNSGYSITFWTGGVQTSDYKSNYKQHVHLIIDIDGPKKGKSIYGKDLFLLSLNFEPQIRLKKQLISIGLTMYGAGENLSRTEIMNNSSYGCKTTGITCGAIIEMDNWTIKDDYPW